MNLKKAIKKMDIAYREASKNLPDLSKDEEFIVMGIKTQFAIDLHSIMNKKKMSVKKLSEKSGLSIDVVESILDMKYDLSFLDIAKLSIALKCDVDMKLSLD